MTASKLLIPTYCIHTELFLKKVDIIISEVNITFEEYDKIFQYDSKDTLASIRTGNPRAKSLLTKEKSSWSSDYFLLNRVSVNITNQEKSFINIVGIK